MILNGLMANIQKCDNGFLVQIVEPPKAPKKKRKHTKGEEDALIDNLMEGVNEMNKQAHGGGEEGESWKGSGQGPTPEKMRHTFKAMFPGLVARALEQEDPEPKVEKLVFPDKKSLLVFLKSRL